VREPRERRMAVQPADQLRMRLVRDAALAQRRVELPGS